MTMGVCRSLLVAAVVASGVGSQLHAAETVERYTDRIVGELKAKNPAAAEMFARANAARDRQEWAEAERLYREVRRLEPDFVHATRRLCGVVLNQGRRTEALGLCRQALTAADIPENHEQMPWALLGTDGNTHPTSEELREARAHATLLLGVPDPNGALLDPACAAAIALKDLELLRRCVGRLEKVAPDEVPTHCFAWVVAMSDRDLDAAHAALERARRLGLSDEQYKSMKAATDEARPWLTRMLPVAAAVLGAWAAGLLGLLGLFGLGLVLSRVALSVAHEPTSVQTGDPVGMTGGLRRVYQAVLWASCLYYYVSIPIVVGLVVVGGGGAGSSEPASWTE